MKSKEEVLKAIQSRITPEIVQATYFSSGCLSVSILPITATTKQGLKFTFRNARLKDDEIMYKILSNAANDGDGFGIDELPTLDCFRMIYLAGNAAVIIEDEATKAIVGVMIFLKSLGGRRATGSIVDTAVILCAEHRHSGLTYLAYAVAAIVKRSVGFKRELGITFASNKAAIKASKKFGLQTIGTFPKGAILRGHGWVDLVYSFKSLNDEVGLISKLGYGHLVNLTNERTFESKL